MPVASGGHPPLPYRAGGETDYLGAMNPVSVEQLDELAAVLRPRLDGELRTDALSRALYATDASMYQVEPLGVVIPRHRDDVAAAVEAAAHVGLPVLPRGSGSSLAGSAVGAALVVDTTRHMDGVLALDPEARTVTVEPGVVLDHLNHRLAGNGLRVGPDPASSNRATLGGMVGTNATGTRSIRYGSVVDHLVSARALLPDGTEVEFGGLDPTGWAQKLRRSGPEGDLYRALDQLLSDSGEAIARDTPPHWRRAGGYRLERLLVQDQRNPAHLLCGSEGTLAFITEITLGLVDRPREAVLGVAHFPTRRAALEAVEAILETDPSAVELFDRIALERAREVADYRRRLHFVQGRPGALLIVEYDGQDRGEAAAGLDRLDRALASHSPSGASVPVTRCQTSAEIHDVWAVRKAGLGLAMSARLPVQCLAFIEDAAVPVEHLPDYIDELERVLAEHDTDAVMYAHASAGCLHVRPFLDTRQPDHVRKMKAIARDSADLVKRYGGIISSEHGDGLARSWLAPGFYGRDLYQAYRDLKQAFDPEGRFNPGRVVEAPPMDRNLRSERPLQVLPVVTEMDWSVEGGLARAVEACNGQGVCRKRLSGTMCPSFMITRQEKDSTRGRANALRSVLSGALPPDALTGPQMQDVMDLCISCKACRSECPAVVDMAAMKAEWQAIRWRTERPPLRARMVAHQPELARRLAGPLAPLANRAIRSTLGRSLMGRLGFAESRPLPPFARHPFRDDEATDGEDPEMQGRARANRHTPTRVALYADTFARFHEPQIPRAARLVLRAAGFQVVVPPYRCCGRTLISKGFLPQARDRIQALMDILHPLAAEGMAIVGLEPSCLLTLRDEARRLLPDDARVDEVAAAAVTFEEFVAQNRKRFQSLFDAGDGGGRRLAGAGRTGLRDDRSQLHDGRGQDPTSGRPILLHGHCHQKALSGMEAGVTCLQVAGLDPEPLDSGCCGMAGSFGYEAEHVNISRMLADRVLAPAIRSAEPGTLVAAAGTSCRHQIADCTGQIARHPAEYLADRLAGS